MKRFPAEFAAMVKPKVWAGQETVRPIAGDADRARWFPLALRRQAAEDGLALLERAMTPYLRPVRSPVDPEWITGMTENYSDSLPKTLRNASVTLNSGRGLAVEAARKIGLMEMMGSATLHAFAERVSGCRLQEDPAVQIIRYRAGDYVGPHNDHHPEEPELREGYVDLQITLSGDGVARQYLLYELDGYFNQMRNVGIASGVSVSMLPFWHQVTPLEVKASGKNKHRWLLLASFLMKGKG